jgi:hypothetical protein
MFIRKKMTSKRQPPPALWHSVGTPRGTGCGTWETAGESAGRRRPDRGRGSEPETESERDRSHLERYRVVCVWRCIRRPVRRAGGAARARAARGPGAVAKYKYRERRELWAPATSCVLRTSARVARCRSVAAGAIYLSIEGGGYEPYDTGARARGPCSVSCEVLCFL